MSTCRRRVRSILVHVVALCMLGGCTLGDTEIRHNTPITHVQLDYGTPEVISDRSGSLERFYVPQNRPAEEWPVDAPRTFYYLEHNLFVTFVNGKAVCAGTIPMDLREASLAPLVELNKQGS